MCVAAGFYLPLRIFSCLTALAFLSLLLLDDETEERERRNERGEEKRGRWPWRADLRPGRRNQREKSSRSAAGNRGKNTARLGRNSAKYDRTIRGETFESFQESLRGRSGIA